MVSLKTKAEVNAVVEKHRKQRAEVEEHAKVHGPPPRCHANRDGDCTWAECPQLRDNEPNATGRSCPHAVYWDPRDEEWE